MSQASDIYSLVYLPEKKRFVRFFSPVRCFLQYKSFRINLLTGSREDVDVKSFWRDLELERMDVERATPKVLHLFYEFGYQLQGMEARIKESSPLAVSLEYREWTEESLAVNDTARLQLQPLQYPSFEQYQPMFDAAMERLLAGDSYQLNITSPFFFRFSEKAGPEDFLSKAWSRESNIGAYAHCSYVGPLNKLFLSNSPECLFEYREGTPATLRSMPIKGTARLKSPSERESAWRRLSSSSKDQAELFMITDLIRNDLTKIQMLPARIVAKKLPLEVPGIIHQYSRVEVDVATPLSLGQVLCAMFPGGSVTGAPKKKTMDILRELENFERGFYCGSTVVLHRGLRAASINIRSCEIDLSRQELKYCSGGGVTLKSDARGEFNEMYSKVESFLSLLKD